MLYPDGTTTRPKVSSPFGPRDPSIGISSLHAGADLIGFTTIRAIADGIVTRSGWMNNAAGNTVTIDHGDGLTSIYMHNAGHHVLRGDRVHEGQALAVMGDSGNASGKCLHLEIRVNGRSIEPLGYIAARLTKPALAGLTPQEETMLLNIKGKKGERRGGVYLVQNGKATFIGARSSLRPGRIPMFTNETEIKRLQSQISGLR